ncbi:hypothetical protein [Enterococcus sp. AZ177]
MILERLAVIDFSFLENQSNAKGWDNMFYDVFKLFNEKEKLLHPPIDSDNDHFIFITQGFIYLKQYDQEKIHIYKNELYKELNEIKGQTLLLMIYDDSEIEMMEEIYIKIKRYLKVNRKLIKKINVIEFENTAIRIYKAFNVDSP